MPRAKIEYTNEGVRGLVVDAYHWRNTSNRGQRQRNDVTLQNTSYWMGPDITIAQASKEKCGLSAEFGTLRAKVLRSVK